MNRRKDALETINKLNVNNSIKEGLLQRVENCKDEVNQQWKESLEFDLEMMRDDNYQYLSQNRIDTFIENISEGFDEESKIEYYLIVQELKEKLEEKYERIRENSFNLILITYGILIVLIVLKLIKIQKEENIFKEKYYRDFPSDDNPYVIEYLMKKKITPLSFSATILNLINKKIIKIEKNPEDEKDVQLILLKKVDNFTRAERTVKEALFDVVGEGGNRCSIKKMKRYARKTSKATKLKSRIDRFYKYAKEEAEEKGYFEKKSKGTLLKIAIVLHYIIMFLALVIGVSFKTSFGSANLKLLVIMSIISFVSYKIVKKDKNRTEEGNLEYSKWLAHKRYLEEFSNFDEKDLPEIALWEKYLVTATILGCADKVERKLKLQIKDTDMYDSDLLMCMSINNNLIRNLNSSVKSTISTANSTVYASTSYSSSSSSGGFGGGSSGGGGRRWTEEAAEVVSKKKKLANRNVC